MVLELLETTIFPFALLNWQQVVAMDKKSILMEISLVSQHSDPQMATRYYWKLHVDSTRNTITWRHRYIPK